MAQARSAANGLKALNFKLPPVLHQELPPKKYVVVCFLFPLFVCRGCFSHFTPNVIYRYPKALHVYRSSAEYEDYMDTWWRLRVSKLTPNIDG